MADESKGSYTYPDTPGDPDRTGVLRNKFGLSRHSELGPAEYAMTHIRQSEIAEGRGPSGNFDKEHQKAIHGFIITTFTNGPVTRATKARSSTASASSRSAAFPRAAPHSCVGSRIDFGLDEALKPIRDPDVLRTATPEQFAERAGQVLAELNYVHPFREGNGRAQEAFIAELGRHYGHEVDFTVISKPRMIEASIETTNDPSSPAMKHVLEDAINPNRREALRVAFADLERCGEKPFEHISARHGGERESPAKFSAMTIESPVLSRMSGSLPSRSRRLARTLARRQYRGLFHRPL
ncbi:MAG: cell filamentation protein Fic [Mesorhizobium sp.]|uniref:Fic/DOC family protein n=2 Tax=Phyllobacteriaceae TaxID=69277 RepID=UPI000FE83C43|nr:Fic family protein [Mesorhizobium sp.]RWG43561.1 MAG: cell filamentation protein Fic [Mesorhizobium sp.]TIN10184.1 MAG: cell filamentation protein Fic [Mesorhizobium sp.]